MAEHFYDTSAAVKHYRASWGRSRSITSSPTPRPGIISRPSVSWKSTPFSPAWCAWGRSLPPRTNACAGLLNDIATGQWQVVQVTPADFQEAQQLLVQHGTTIGLRTLDAIQLATALGPECDPGD